MSEINLGNTRGITRKIDGLGRVTIPKSFREELGIKEWSLTEVFMVEDGIFIKPKKGGKNVYWKKNIKK